MLKRLTICSLAPLVIAYSAEASSKADGPMYQEEYASVEGVIQAIATCRGFAQDWNQWLSARKSEGWQDTWEGASGTEVIEKTIKVDSTNMVWGDLSILAALTTHDKTEKKDRSGRKYHYSGKDGRCDVVMKVRSYEDERELKAQVRGRLDRIKPDFNGITYISDTERLMFNQMKNVKKGNPVTILVQLGFRDTKTIEAN